MKCTANLRIPITAVTVVGASVLLTVSIIVVLYLGIQQAAESTRQLWATQSETLIGAMEQSLQFQLQPVRGQARSVARDIDNTTRLDRLDYYMRGVLSATPQVAGVAIFTPDGKSRQWYRKTATPRDANWSHRKEIMTWLASVKSRGHPSWRAPIIAEGPLQQATLLHDMPLYNQAGQFIGAFAQVVPVAELSQLLAQNYTDTGITPFILYDRQFVLVHPGLNADTANSEPGNLPLPELDTFDDAVLARIWTPDQDSDFISKALTQSTASGLQWGDDYFLFIYRTLEHYGPAPWTIGAYINTSLITDNASQRLRDVLVAAAIVLLLAIVAAVIVGRKVSTPIKAIAQAAEKVKSGEFNSVPILPHSHIHELDSASSAFNNMVQGLTERALIRDTLGRFVPEAVASSLLASGGHIEPVETEATILFCDIESFTQLTESLGPVRIIEVLNTFFSAMVPILEQHGGVVTQFQGDAILATFNIPVSDPQHAANAVCAAQAMLAVVEQTAFAEQSLSIRIGINSGTLVAGAVGAKGRLSYTVHGDAVNLAARLESLNKQYNTRLLVSEHTVKLADEENFTRIGETHVRGQKQSITLFTLNNSEKNEISTMRTQ